MSTTLLASSRFVPFCWGVADAVVAAAASGKMTTPMTMTTMRNPMSTRATGIAVATIQTTLLMTKRRCRL
jgi:hypothetical protein